MTSNIASHALKVADILPHNGDMPRKARPIPKHKRKPTFIRAWRKHRGMTLVQVCERLEHLHEMEMSDGQLSRIERGDQPYSQDVLEAIADVLGTEAASLIMRDPLAPDPIWSIWDTLKPVEKAQAVEVIKALKRAG